MDDQIFRVLLAGSPDVGKSTFIGQLLLQTNSVYQDQVEPDLAFYTDGLVSERERKSTIDVSYKTVLLPSGRRCVLVDTPGQTALMSTVISALSYVDYVFLLTKDGELPPQYSVCKYLDKQTKIIKTHGTETIDGFTPDFAVDSLTAEGFQPVIEFLEKMAAAKYINLN